MAASDLPHRLVLDNGSGFVKVGWAGRPLPKVVLPNCVGQLRSKQHPSYVGDQCYSLSEYFCHRPFSNGLLMELDMIRDVWERAFGRGYMSCNTEELAVCITEPYLTPSTIRHSLSEILFEDFGFKRMLICPAQVAVPYGFWGLHWGQMDIVRNAVQHGLPATTCYVGDAEVLSTKQGENSEGKRVGNRVGRMSANERRGVRIEDAFNYPTNGVEEDNRYCTIDPNFLHRPKSKLPAVRSSRNPCSIVVDCGFSCCQVMPFFEYQPLEAAALRTDIGGQHMNAYLKNLLSYRTVNLEQNELLVQHMKEECCFVSQDYTKEMAFAKAELKHPSGGAQRHTHLYHEYVLPDFNVKNRNLLLYFFTSHRATNSSTLVKHPHCFDDIPKKRSDTPQPEAKQGETQNGVRGTPSSTALDVEAPQVVPLNNERITVPELLFHPNDVNKNECSLPELIYRSISLTPEVMQPFFSRQILLVGGTASMPGFKERLWKELRSMLPASWKVCIYQHENPQNSVWTGASQYAHDESVFSMYSITRRAYYDYGSYSGKPYAPWVEK